MDTPHNQISDYDLQALVDDILDQEARQRLLRRVRENPRLWRRLEELHRQKTILKEWWRSVPLV